MQPPGEPVRDRDSLSRWWASLDDRARPWPRPTRLLPIALSIGAICLAASMPLRWHRLIVPEFVYYGPPTTQWFDGVAAQSWLIAMAAVALLLAARTFRTGFGVGGKWVVTLVAFASANGMVVDYIDWSLRGVSRDVPPYFGPGYFVALAGAVPLVFAAVVAWRTPS